MKETVFVSANFIAALLYSEEKESRLIAVGRISETRSIPIKEPKNGLKDGIRVNVAPVINFECKNWSKLINLNVIDCFDPPCVELSNEELLDIKQLEKPLQILCPTYKRFKEQ